MHGSDGAWVWGIGLITFAFGLGCGFALAYGLLRGGSRKVIERELESLRAQFDAYRGRVDDSFHRTSELFEGMTRQYRAVYEHLAESAETLCTPGAGRASLDFPDARRLAPGGGAEAANAPEPAAEAVGESGKTRAAGDGGHHDARHQDDGDAPVGDVPAPVARERASAAAADRSESGA